MSAAHAPSMRSELAQLRLELATVRAERDGLEHDLNLRNWALDAATAHFMILDMMKVERPIVFVNRALAQNHGYHPAELVGATPDKLVAAELCPEEMRQIDEAMTRGLTLRTVLHSRRKDNSTFMAGIFIGPIRDGEGRVTHYLCVGADITARLQEEAAKRELQERLYREMEERERMEVGLRIAQKLEAVGQLAAGVAHEINTPVQYVGDSLYFLRTAVESLNELLIAYRAEIEALIQEDNAAPATQALVAARDRLLRSENCADLDFLRAEVPRAFERASAGVERVATIVRAMKEFAHPDSPEHAPADLNHAIETTLVVAQNEFKYRAQVETRLGTIPEVMCNIGELNQVFLNLIVNAAHAIQEAGHDADTGRISIETQAEGDWVRVTVEDNGCGISEENIEKIFDPFFTTKEVGRGTGQGLSITRSIVYERHGGRIEVQSEVGRGTSLTVWIPIGGREAAGST